MSIKISNQKKSKYLEKIRWLLISIILILSILINTYFNKIHIFFRTCITFFNIILMIGIILRTEKGKSILFYINASQREIKKIVWPPCKETLYTTCIIIFITILMSLLLWGLDSIIFRLIAFVISLRF